MDFICHFGTHHHAAPARTATAIMPGTSHTHRGTAVIFVSSHCSYDGKSVAFTYKEHRMTSPAVLQLSAEDFLARLIPHIPDVNFRVVRYGGFYANRLRGTLLPVVSVLKNSKRTYAQAKEHLSRLTCWWRRRVEAMTRIDPLFCDICLIPLTLFSVVYLVRNPDPYG
jgi:putative transposase